MNKLKLFYSLAIMMVSSLPLLTCLECYHCDLAANLSCPGWTRCCVVLCMISLTGLCRPPIDSVIAKGDVVGLYTMCVTVTLGDGRMVEQNIYPGETHCQQIFRQAWRMLLNSQWNQVRLHKIYCQNHSSTTTQTQDNLKTT